MRRRPAPPPAPSGERSPAGRRSGRSRTGAQLHRRGTGPPAPPPERGSPTRRTGRLTGRAAVLGLALCAALLTLAYPTRQFLTQRAQISQLQQHQADQRRQVAELKVRQQEWRDPAYVKAQARKRLQYVMPGEIGYVVLDPRGQRAGGRSPAHPVTVAPQQSAQHLAWYSQLWGTVRAADAPS